LLGVLALGLAPGSIAGQDRIQERHELRPDASVQIRGVSHSIQVERWDRSEIEVTGDYDRDREELEVRADPVFRIPEWALRREYRTTYRRHLGARERIVSGRWQGRIAPGSELIPVSLEKGIAETVNFDHIKQHYYLTHTEINPSRIVPLGPLRVRHEPGRCEARAAHGRRGRQAGQGEQLLRLSDDPGRHVFEQPEPDADLRRARNAGHLGKGSG
jgi:hypothetical protein